MGMVGRQYAANASYRFGFNGKENDNEAKGEGNQQDYGMRIYDARIGRFLSVDPLMKSYPFYTPYSFAGNKPIEFIDLDGGEEKKHWTEYSFRDLLMWMQSPDDPLEDDGFVHQVTTDINRSVNPIYNGAALVVGEESLGIPSNFTPLSRSDAGINLMTQWMWWKYSKLSSSTGPGGQMENQSRVVSSNTQNLHRSQQTALGLSNEEKQKVITWIKQNSSVGSPLKIPQGLTEGQFNVMSQRIANQTGHISTNVVIQGSRASGTASLYSDIDIAIKVNSDQFGKLIKDYFGTPNSGSASERTMNHALKTGKIQAGEANLSALRKNLEKLLGIKVDISIIKIGGQFDNGTQIPTQAAVPSGIR